MQNNEQCEVMCLPVKITEEGSAALESDKVPLQDSFTSE